MRIYAVLDRKAKMVCCSFVSQNDNTAQRSFEDLLSGVEDNAFTLHPEDFSLVLAFEVDDNTLFKLDTIIDGSSFSKAVLEKNRTEKFLFWKKIESLKNVSRETSEA